MNYYTYAYLREDGTPYYIGKGKGRRWKLKSHTCPVPPKERVLFLKKNLTEEEAFLHEQYIISILGRKDLGTGILRNRTDGGEGRSGSVPWNRGVTHSEETREKMRKAHTKRTEYNVGRVQSEATKQKLREAALKQHANGYRHPKQIEVTIDGVTYPSITKASQSLGISRRRLTKLHKMCYNKGE